MKEITMTLTMQGTLGIKPGIYRHYKGGLYTVFGLVTHHETRQRMVLYVSLTTGTFTVRPLVGTKQDPDGFNDVFPLERLDPETREDAVREARRHQEAAPPALSNIQDKLQQMVTRFVFVHGGHE